MNHMEADLTDARRENIWTLRIYDNYLSQPEPTTLDIPEEGWITCGQQLRRIQWVLADEVVATTSMATDTARLVNQYVVDNQSGLLTGWYTASQKLYENAEDGKVPPLDARRLFDIMNSRCPFSNANPEDDIRCKDSHMLTLIRGRRSFSRYMERVLEPYGLQEYQGRNPFQFRRRLVEREVLQFQFPYRTNYWALIPNVLLGRGMNYNQRVEIIEDIRVVTGENYDIATLAEIATATFQHKVVSGASLFSRYVDPHDNSITNFHTQVRETTEDRRHLTFGDFADNGVLISHGDNPNDPVTNAESVGVAPILRL